MDRGSRLRVPLVGAVLLILGCSLFEDEENLEVRISASASVASPSDPVTLTVTAENRGGSRVLWGKGSSTCQLTTVVRVEGREYPAPDITKVCTADLVEAGLDPGETRTEVFHWRGHATLPDTFGVLLPGKYEVRGAAGNKARSAPVVIEVMGSM
ncbi:MAG: hypothetical protein GTN93_21200 [Anaerolineae bacterium]|nr:hypothetical protein [Anaerolineae bacterium]NIQ80560.1 hypothetical protein [Anaerolineae bacterium]